MTREERIAQAAPLKEQGLTYPQIAERLGVSHNTVARLFSDRAHESSKRASREAKQRRTGTCEDCGATTRYNGHADAVSRYCHPCISARQAPGKRGTGLTGEVLEYLSEPRRFSEIRDHFGLYNGYVAQMLVGRLMPYGLVTRLSRGVYQRTDAL
jgi:transcriptional regulator with XRE-family HTH domain